jgi:hypothetical protein
MPVGLVNEALLDCGHDGAATKPSNLAEMLKSNPVT